VRKVGPYWFTAQPAFSSDGQHLAYSGEDSQGCHLFVDGQPKELASSPLLKSANCPYSISLSPDGTHIAYIVGTGAEVGPWVAVVDGLVRGAYDTIGVDKETHAAFFFSPDGRHFAYSYESDSRWFQNIDGRVEGPYDLVCDTGPWFSPDSKHIAYCAYQDGKWLVVSDGHVVGRNYEGINSDLVFRPDSQMLVYAATVAGKVAIFKDGAPGKFYDSIGQYFAFSPDSQHLAFAAQTGSSYFLVDDSAEIGHYKGVDFPTFSPDSHHLAYAAVLDNSWRMIADGNIGPPYTRVYSLKFSPDSKHVAYLAKVGEENFAVMDGKESRRFERILKSSEIVFDSPRQFHFLPFDGNEPSGTLAVYSDEVKF
jgi:Tol biopolymer transport system component